MKHIAIILAGGTGSRSGLSYPKQFAPLGGKPLIGHTLSAFQNHPLIDAILCVSHAEYIDQIRRILESCSISKAAAVISGGAMLADGKRVLDSRLQVEHIARDTRCDLRWRGLASERGKLNFHGGIHIRVGADGTDAQLSNRNLLLSDSAEVNTQPVLVIDADEVKAAHGATVGQLDHSALFYLQSRGIPQAEARAMLMQAFLIEVLDVLEDEALAESLLPVLQSRFERNPKA